MSNEKRKGVWISIDGDKWCALLGEDPVVGVAGFGDDPISAIQDLRDRICQTKRLLDKDPFIDWSFQFHRNILEKQVVRQAIELGEFIELQDCRTHWFPSVTGGISAPNLRAIADYLDVQNTKDA